MRPIEAPAWRASGASITFFRLGSALPGWVFRLGRQFDGQGVAEDVAWVPVALICWSFG